MGRAEIPYRPRTRCRSTSAAASDARANRRVHIFLESSLGDENIPLTLLAINASVLMRPC